MKITDFQQGKLILRRVRQARETTQFKGSSLSPLKKRPRRLRPLSDTTSLSVTALLREMYSLGRVHPAGNRAIFPLRSQASKPTSLPLQNERRRNAVYRLMAKGIPQNEVPRFWVEGRQESRKRRASHRRQALTRVTSANSPKSGVKSGVGSQDQLLRFHKEQARCSLGWVRRCTHPQGGGDARSVMRRFRASRFVIRSLARVGRLPGVVKK